jgi:hypothetical protein
LGVGPPWTNYQSLLTLPSLPLFAGGEHLDGFLEAVSSRLWFLGASDPIEKFLFVRVSQFGEGSFCRLMLGQESF